MLYLTQYYDLLNIFEMNGLPSDSNPYLFNGDFVDRGSFSVECIFTLLAFKCLYPHGEHAVTRVENMLTHTTMERPAVCLAHD